MDKVNFFDALAIPLKDGGDNCFKNITNLKFFPKTYFKCIFNSLFENTPQSKSMLLRGLNFNNQMCV